MKLILKEEQSSKLNLKCGEIESALLCEAAERVNNKLIAACEGVVGVKLDLYEIIDLRMLSGMIGEMFTAEISSMDNRLLKNPNIDGYPDLCDVSDPNTARQVALFQISDFLNFKDGGFEVKNTFGVKKSKTHIAHRESRLMRIQKRLVWKAHHRETNHLLALFSDYISGIPQIVACFYSDQLTEEDWTVKQQPKKNSTMTSFCQTTKSAYEKLKSGLIFCSDEDGYENFIR